MRRYLTCLSAESEAEAVHPKLRFEFVWSALVAGHHKRFSIPHDRQALRAKTDQDSIWNGWPQVSRTACETVPSCLERLVASCDAVLASLAAHMVLLFEAAEPFITADVVQVDLWGNEPHMGGVPAAKIPRS